MTPDLVARLFWPFLTVIVMLLVTGFYCVLATFNLVRVLIGIELLVKAATLLIILAGYLTGRSALAQTLAITLIIVEVVLMVVASGIVLWVFRHNRTIDTRTLRNLKG